MAHGYAEDEVTSAILRTDQRINWLARVPQGRHSRTMNRCPRPLRKTKEATVEMRTETV